MSMEGGVAKNHDFLKWNYMCYCIVTLVIQCLRNRFKILMKNDFPNRHFTTKKSGVGLSILVKKRFLVRITLNIAHLLICGSHLKNLLSLTVSSLTLVKSKKSICTLSVTDVFHVYCISLIA